MATEIIKTDVVICGSGSAGVCAAVSLAQGGVRFRMLESRDGPLERGQADGVQCRTVEIFDSFGVSEELLRQAYHVNELTFWAIDETSGALVRTSRAPDTPIGISCQPHVILNQALLIKILLEKMREFAPEQTVDYDTSVLGVRFDHVGADPDYPIEVRTTHAGKERIYNAKYVLACDGSHSNVRRSLGIQMVGDSTDAVWGVMDIFPRTNFPDIRKKATIHTDNGALVIIPREGGQMVRFYLQMPAGTNSKAATLDDLHARAAAILHGYDFEVADTFWWSAYTIGQRVASAFTAGHGRIILTGDSCHTHSPKAGQGMNVSLQDGYNVAWKLSHVLSGRLPPSSLHETYVLEREKVARDLIEFDRRLTQFYSESDDDKQGVKFKEHFIKSAKYMAGLTSRYEESCLTNYTSSEQEAATEVLVGMRFPSAKVVRYCDVKEMQFQKALPSDGRWKVVVFIGDLQKSECAQNLQEVRSKLMLQTISCLTLYFHPGH